MFNLFKTKEPKWWEKEAEENGMSVEQYLYQLKFEKEKAELGRISLKRKEEARSRREKWDDHQAEQFEEEKEKVEGYKQIAKVHSAYISILLKKLGATKDNAVVITAGEIKEALEKYEARAMPTEDGFGLYCEVVAGE